MGHLQGANADDLLATLPTMSEELPERLDSMSREEQLEHLRQLARDVELKGELDGLVTLYRDAGAARHVVLIGQAHARVQRLCPSIVVAQRAAIQLRPAAAGIERHQVATNEPAAPSARVKLGGSLVTCRCGVRGVVRSTQVTTTAWVGYCDGLLAGVHVVSVHVS